MQISSDAMFFTFSPYDGESNINYPHLINVSVYPTNSVNKRCRGYAAYTPCPKSYAVDHTSG